MITKIKCPSCGVENAADQTECRMCSARLPTGDKVVARERHHQPSTGVRPSRSQEATDKKIAAVVVAGVIVIILAFVFGLPSIQKNKFVDVWESEPNMFGWQATMTVNKDGSGILSLFGQGEKIMWRAEGNKFILVNPEKQEDSLSGELNPEGNTLSIKDPEEGVLVFHRRKH